MSAPTPLSLPTGPGFWWVRTTCHGPERRNGPIGSTSFRWCVTEVTEHEGKLYNGSDDTYMGAKLIVERRAGPGKGAFYTWEWVGPLTPPSIP